VGAGTARFEGVRKWAEKFSADHLGNYIDRVKREPLAYGNREFNDPVWATISLTPFESIIVDTPLFQRLRRIRQLGVVHWIYPGAVHTRFEHSIGAVHQITQLVDAINRTGSRNANARIEEDKAAFLRFAALCHDLGHGAMSHVTEYAVTEFPDVHRMLGAFADHHQIESVSLSEMAAYYLLGSKPFRELVDCALKLAHGPKPPANAVDLAQKAIVGEIVFNNIPLLQELVSGPFDADKLDYMQRDALMAGIPGVTDVPRLVRKVRAELIEEAKLPSRIASRVQGAGGMYTIFGIAISGSRTLDELLIARILLFDKVYRHQKVRAIQGMVTVLFRALSELYNGHKFQLPYIFTDDLLLEADSLYSLNKGFKKNPPPVAVAILKDLCTRLRDRRLFVRAFAFGMHMPSLDDEPAARRGMGKFLATVEGALRDAFVKKLATETDKALHIVKDDLVASRFGPIPLDYFLWIDPPSRTDHSKKVAHAFLIGENRELTRYSEHAGEIPHWSQGYLAKKDIGFVFCAPELKAYVYLAMEKILASNEYAFRVPSSALSYLKVDTERLRQLRLRLTQGGFYKFVQFSLRPTPERLLKADIGQHCISILGRLHSYSPPALQTSHSPITNLNETRIRSWLCQFEEDDVIEVALQVLLKFRLIGRSDYVKAMKDFVTANQEFHNAVVVSFGDAKDSGNIVAYLVQDTGLAVKSLDAALDLTNPIIFVDDFIGSGGQAEGIVANWYGELPALKLGEGIRTRLSKRSLKRLGKRPVAFVYAAGWDDGEAALLKSCKNRGLDPKVHIGIREAELPTCFDEALRSLDGHAKFLKKTKKDRGILIETAAR
jgi:HD superfamily phosphohydrolase